MKTISLLILAMALGSVGCAKNYKLENDWGSTPGYSSTERYQQIYRTWDYEGKQLNDDVDHVLLLRPSDKLTLWNVQ